MGDGNAQGHSIGMQDLGGHSEIPIREKLIRFIEIGLKI